ncbi:MAG: hypothetical protein LCH81_14415 [Bacteroidetes bacterium]|nr:hypothetical protein [Bacteroidota bacterium]
MQVVIFLLLIIPVHAFSQVEAMDNQVNEYNFEYHTLLSIRDTLSGLPLLKKLVLDYGKVPDSVPVISLFD